MSTATASLAEPATTAPATAVTSGPAARVVVALHVTESRMSFRCTISRCNAWKGPKAYKGSF